MMTIMNEQIIKDGEKLDKISENLTYTEHNMVDTNELLGDCADNYQKMSIKKVIFYGGLGSLLGGVIGGPIGFAVGAKVGVITLTSSAIGGGLLGSVGSNYV